ncbi:MAG: hypothetical protein SH809_11110 [Rhodothermales bacterium]|nr:hypothetical protein [Rhodothermales bacterium]
MRTAGLLVSLLLASLLSIAHAQSKPFFVDVGVSSGERDYKVGIRDEGRVIPAWSVRLGREKEINPDIDVHWGVRYSLLIDRSNRLVAFPEASAQMTQHYIALGMLLAFDARYVKVLFGPELGYLVHARFDIKGSRANSAWTAGGPGPGDRFTRRNMMVSFGLGKEWRLGGQNLYAHLLANRTVSSARDGRSYLAGYRSEYVLRTGVQF